MVSINLLLPRNNADVDECSEGVAECEQNCHNNDDSYTCSCSAGYELADDGFNCTGKPPTTKTSTDTMQ